MLRVTAQEKETLAAAAENKSLATATFIRMRAMEGLNKSSEGQDE